jgi:hypothetical protein
MEFIIKDAFALLVNKINNLRKINLYVSFNNWEFQTA